MNMFDKIDVAKVALENGITELERDAGRPDDAEQFKDQIDRAIKDLYAARRALREVME